MTFAQTLDELTDAANQVRIDGTCFFKVGAISAITIS
jgi:hypothetical protein